MRILVHSRVYPSVGGIETVTQLLANEWNKAGEEVIVATDVAHTPERPEIFPYPVYYQPSPLEMDRLTAGGVIFTCSLMSA